MKTQMSIGLGALALGGIFALSAPAEARDCCQGRERCPMMAGQPAGAPGSDARPDAGRIYDPDTVTTLRGTASAVAVVPARGGRMGGVHVTLQGEGQAMDVHLGPTWFLQREGFEVAKGDSIEVTGSVVESSGSTFLIARELKKGQKVLKLRDEQGKPEWSGRRRP